MNPFLAQMYNTNGASQEVQEKVAAVDLFLKVAEEQGFSAEKIASMSDEEVAYLFNETFKEASDDSPPAPPFGGKESKKEEKEEKEDDDKEKKAAEELAQQKFAESDFGGRIMAHALVDELNKIKQAEQEKAASVATKAKELFERGKGHVTEAAGAAKNKASEIAEKGKNKASELAEKGKEMKDKTLTSLKDNAAPLGVGAAGGAAVGAAVSHAASGEKGRKKKASVFDERAADLAIAKIAQASAEQEAAGQEFFNLEYAAQKIAEILDAGGIDDDSSKVASNMSLEQAAEVRALEMLELCGYPVSWE